MPSPTFPHFFFKKQPRTLPKAEQFRLGLQELRGDPFFAEWHNVNRVIVRLGAKRVGPTILHPSTPATIYTWHDGGANVVVAKDGIYFIIVAQDDDLHNQTDRRVLDASR